MDQAVSSERHVPDATSLMPLHQPPFTAQQQIESASEEASNAAAALSQVLDEVVHEDQEDVAPTVSLLQKSAVDELIRHLDATDPCHKLRSLCKKGDAADLSAFLLSGPDGLDLNAVSEEGWTCLHEIITHDCQFTEVARILLSHGANVNTQDLHGDSPLHSSLLYHNTDNIKLLLSHGANVELSNNSGRRPIHVANDEESLRLLLEHGADVNAHDQVGNTSLHYAVVAKDKDRVQLLLQFHSDVTSKNASGSTPLHLANDSEIAQLLLEHSADPNATDMAGNSPLHLAVRGRHKDIVRQLLDKRADPSLCNGSGKAPSNLAKDKEMRSILQGKPFVASSLSVPSSSSSSSSSSSISSSSSSLSVMTKKRPTPSNGISPPSITPSSVVMEVKETPGILKKKRRISNENGERTSRLRFSDVNEYSYVDPVAETLEKRVKVRPIYSELHFSSDED